MNRLALASAVLMVGAAGAYAGPVTVALTGLNNNLATGYMPCLMGCSPSDSSNTVVTKPPSGSSVGFSTVLFNSAEVPFNIASGGADNPSGSGDSNNIWSPDTVNATKTLTEDVGNYTGSTPDAAGLFNVDQIWTLINDQMGAFGYQGITIILTGFNPNTDATITETINLEDGIDYRSIGTGSQLSSTVYPVACDVANQSGSNLGVSCAGDTSATTASSGTDSRSGLSTTPGVSVTVYNDVFQTSDPQGDSYGLDVQNINLGSAFLGNYLNTVEFVNKGTGTQSEDIILSGLTVDAVPEPGTVFLFGAGIAGLLVFQLRRSKKA
jgi:hypothetical protein